MTLGPTRRPVLIHSDPADSLVLESIVGTADGRSARRSLGRRGPECNPPAERSHRLIKQLYLLMKAEQMSRVELIRRSGVPYGTMKDWWRGQTTPRVDLLDAAFGVFELELKPRAKE